MINKTNLRIEELKKAIDINRENFREWHTIANVDEFFDSWVLALEQVYKKYDADFKIFCNVGEVFQENISIGTSEMYLTFLVERLRAQLKGHSPKELSVYSFSTNSGAIKYTDIPNIDFSHPNIMPVIIVPFSNNGFDYLLVDGNHRVTATVKQGKSTIFAHFMSSNETFQSLLTDLDKSIYAFLFECDNCLKRELVEPEPRIVDISKSLACYFILRNPKP